MKIQLPTSARQKVKIERQKTFEKMTEEGISTPKWDELNKKYLAYSDMLKPTWTVTPDTLLLATTNLVGILLVLNFEKLDIIRSKAIGFVLKGRV